MIPTKAYIIRISSEISKSYADMCAESCRNIGLPYAFFEGVENMRSYDAWVNTGLNIKKGSMDHRKDHIGVDPAACCSASHALVWDLISKSGECSVILEHDALMLYPINLDIPDGKIVGLGYKTSDPQRYDHISAGAPTKFIDMPYMHGAHAYAITPNTADMLLHELAIVGGGGPIDNRFFLKHRTTKVPLAMIDPPAAIGWVRQSTIWDEADVDSGFATGSFLRNLR